MKLSTAITLVSLAAAIAIPSALSASPPDAFERAVNRHVAVMPAALQRAAVHADTTLDPAIATAIRARQNPAATDATLVAESPVVMPTMQSGFAWREFTIGAGAMLGLLLLLGGLRTVGHAFGRKRVHPSAG